MNHFVKKIATFFGVIIYSLSFSQPTFVKVIDNVKDYESVYSITEIVPGEYLFNIHQINPNFSLTNTDFGYKHLLYLLDDSGSVLSSLTFTNLDQYFIIVRNVIKSANNDILYMCDALDSLTLDIQLCLLHTDFELNILSYNFYGYPDSTEHVLDFCINENQNLIFAGAANRTFGQLDGGYLLWETDFNGNTLKYKIDTTYAPFCPTIMQLPGNGKYYVGDGRNSVLIYNQDFELENLYVIDSDSTGFLGMPWKKYKLLDDFHYLIYGMQIVFDGIGWPTSVWDMAIKVMDQNFDTLHTYTYGTPDTFDLPNNMDFIDTNRIFLAGVKNYTNQPPEDSWMSIYITNLQGDTLNSRYYGGYGSYNVGTGLATSDGGYIYAIRWFDFANYTPPDPIDWDIVIMKVNSEGLLTDINTPIPFEVTDIIVYPNPGGDYFNICSSYRQVRVLLYTIDGDCVIDRIISGTSSITTTGLSAGTYLYRILEGEREIKTGKWVKK